LPCAEDAEPVATAQRGQSSVLRIGIVLRVADLKRWAKKMNPYVPYLVLFWLLAPWLVIASKAVRVSVYEVRLGLHSGVWPFGFAELFRRIAERRKTDLKYDQMRAGLTRWFVITAAWWIFSFAGAAIFAFAFAVWSTK
jgi:hypothetical protein